MNYHSLCIAGSFVWPKHTHNRDFTEKKKYQKKKITLKINSKTLKLLSACSILNETDGGHAKMTEIHTGHTFFSLL